MMEFKTLEDYVGQTPLVRLKRIAAGRNNVILAKLEGNNPAGSVKDRPALSMILRAEARGEIAPGQTLIEATSNTGIALAMAAAIRGYGMILVMPENQSIERRQSMSAFGAELVLTPKEGGMELARDVASRMRDEGRGVILDQFANPDNPLAHFEGAGRRDCDPFHQQHGHYGHDHGCVRLSEREEPGDPHCRLPAYRWVEDSRHPQMA